MYGSKFETGWGRTSGDGSFAFYLPIGDYNLTSDQDNYSLMPTSISVTSENLATPLNLGNLTAYAAGAGADLIAGTVTGGSPSTGELITMAMLEPVNVTPENWG